MFGSCHSFPTSPPPKKNISCVWGVGLTPFPQTHEGLRLSNFLRKSAVRCATWV